MKTKCISSYTGKMRSCYSTFEEAKKSADFMYETKNLKFYPYKCDKCGFYHLGLEKDKIKFDKGVCHCTDTNGEAKNLYFTYEDALKAKNKAEHKRRVKLLIYKCPECNGWHLSHIKKDYKILNSVVATVLFVAVAFLILTFTL